MFPRSVLPEQRQGSMGRRPPQQAAEQVVSPDPSIAWPGRLKGRARELGIPDAEVARRVGLAANRYSNYVNGIREPDLRMFARICRALATTPDAVLGFGRSVTEDSPHERLVARGTGALSALRGRNLALAVHVLESIGSFGATPIDTDDAD